MTFTKEWLQKAISDIETMRDEIPFGLDEDGNNTLAAFKTVLAGMEAEPYGYVHKAIYESQGSCGLSNDQEAHRDSSTHIAVYAAPQPLTTSERAELENYRNAQQVVPEEIPRLHDGNKFKYVRGGIRFSSHYANGWNACRAAMLQGIRPADFYACSRVRSRQLLRLL